MNPNPYQVWPGKGQPPPEKRLVLVILLSLIFQCSFCFSEFDDSLSVRVHSGVHFTKLDKKSYNAFLPIYYHFNLEHIPNSTERSDNEQHWTSVSSESLNTQSAYEIKYNFTKV